MTGCNEHRAKTGEFEGILANVGQVLLQYKIPEGADVTRKDPFTIAEGTGILIK